MRALRAPLVAAAAANRRRAKPTNRSAPPTNRDFYRNATALSPVKTVAAVVLSHNHESTVTRIADALDGEVDAIVIVEDGSTRITHTKRGGRHYDRTKTLSLFKLPTSTRSEPTTEGPR